MLTVSLIALTLMQTAPASGTGDDCLAGTWTDACTDARRVRMFDAFDAGEACVGLQACLAVLDAQGEDFHFEDLHAFGTKLLSFGQPARTALLDRAVSGRSPIVFDVLHRHGVDWSPGDVARLINLFRDTADERLLRALSDTGDPRADRIILDLALASGQPSAEVRHVAASLFPYHWPEFLAAIEQRLDRGGGTLDESLRFRLSRTEAGIAEAVAREATAEHARNHRLAAIMLLMQMEDRAAPAETILLGIADDPDREIANLAQLVLTQTGNATYARDLAERRCPVITDPFADFSAGSMTCPYGYFSRHPDAALYAGPVFVRHLRSSSGDQRRIAAAILSEAFYTQAVPDFRLLLGSDNWRDVDAAIRALYTMQAGEALSDLRALSVNHWHPYIREFAADAATAIESGEPGESAAFSNWARTYAEGYARPSCPSHRWHWQGRELPSLTLQPTDPETGLFLDTRLDIVGGYLSGMDGYANGGSLEWRPYSSDPEVVFEGNVVAMLPYESGALIAAGTDDHGDHGGQVYRLEFSQTGDPILHLVAELPGLPAGGMALSEDRLFAISERRDGDDDEYFVTVFDAEIGILGLADCVTD